MEDDDDEDEDSDLDEDERAAIKDAAASAALSKIMARTSRLDPKAPLYDRILQDWVLVGQIGEYYGYSGQIGAEIAYKLPKTRKGGCRFWNEMVFVMSGGRVVSRHQVKYVDGFRRSNIEIFEKMVERLSKR